MKDHKGQKCQARIPVACVSGGLALIVILICAAAGAESDDPADEKNLLNEKTWPVFVQYRALEIADEDDAVTRLLKERYNEGQRELRNRYVFWLQDVESLPQVYDAARRVIEARLEAGGPESDKITILEELEAFAKVCERQAETLKKKFNHWRQAADVHSAKYFRASIELELLRARQDAKDAPDE